MAPARPSPLALILTVSGVLVTQSLWAQDLGHRVPGTLGFNAGSQPQAGLYFGDRFAIYTSNQARGPTGAVLPIQGLDIDALVNAFAVALTVKLPGAAAPYLTGAIALPVATASLHSDNPAVNLSRTGLGDLYILPTKVGWRTTHLDVVSSYGLYVPTGSFQTGGDQLSLGKGQVTHEFSGGGTAYFDRSRSVFLSALASYDLNQPKIGMAITRGDTVQIQGGAGVRIFKYLGLGVASYALWQVRDNRGSQLSAALVAARDQVYGAGPEAAVIIPHINVALDARYEHDFGVRSRFVGQLAIFSLTWRPWQPPNHTPTSERRSSGSVSNETYDALP